MVIQMTTDELETKLNEIDDEVVIHIKKIQS